MLADQLTFFPTATVRFEPSGLTVVVEPGTLLLDAARQAGLPVAQSCGGFAICSWCRMQIMSGSANLVPIEPREALLHKREGFRENERASCQTGVMGDVVVTTTYW